MKKLLFIIASVALGHASAAPCTSGTLASYIALGSTGCILGNLTVSDFTYRARASGGAPEITADQIMVTTILPPIGMFALQFSAPWDVQSGQDQFSGIAYHVAAASATMPVQELRLDANGFKVGMFGNAVVRETIVAGSISQNLQVYETCDEVCRSKTSATLDLNPGVATLIVRDAVVLEAKFGAASLASFVDWFVICIPCV